MKQQYILPCIFFSLIALNACTQAPTSKYLKDQPDGLYGEIKVQDKIIFFTLYYQKTPLTITSFVGLAKGLFEDHIDRKGNYFEGITFHRVVDNFVIQGGDPTGSGSGGPGYSFEDEFDSSLTHDSIGIFSMANSGPNTNGSQFFITLSPTPHLDNVHSVFGKVLVGEDVLTQVVKDDVIQSITIFPKGKSAKTFVKTIDWDGFQQLKTDIENKKRDSLLAKQQQIIDEITSDSTLTKTPEGVYYKLENKGTGPKVKNGDTIKVHYELTLYGQSKVIDSSFGRDEPLEVTLGAKQVIPGWEIALQNLRVGDRAKVVIPPNLAYGEAGAGSVIPGGSFLSFIMEIISIQ